MVRGRVIDRLLLVRQRTQPTRAVADTCTVALTRRTVIGLVSTTLVVLMVVISGRGRATGMRRLAMTARVMRATEHSGTRQARDLERNQ